MTSAESLAGLPVHCISLPTPFPVGRVNAYLVRGDPPALVDCGVRSSRSLLELEAGLGDLGVRLGELGSILLTHPHYDHAGAAAELGRRTGATVRYHATGSEPPEKRHDELRDVLLGYGAPQDLIQALDFLNQKGEGFGEPLEAAPRRAPIQDGTEIRVGDLTLRAHHTPGHNAGHLCYEVVGARAIFCGDLLLPTITPNPLPHFDETAPRGRRSSLGLYLGSLDRVEALGPQVGLGGHGLPMPDLLAVARQAREAIGRRREAVRSLCRRHAGATLFSLAERLFEERDGIQRVLAFTEVLAHCDALEDLGELEVDHASGRVARLLC